MEESKKIKYEVPRNVKGGGVYWNLNWKGWVALISIFFLSSVTFFLIFGYSLFMFLGIAFSIAAGHFIFQIDEKSGYYNFQIVFLFLEKRSNSKTLTPQWGGKENENQKIKKPVITTVKTKK
ncbi:hypothetical protein IAE23_29305 [Bacillus sp. S35]|uniref:hypothetical protein n=1 Tax=Priestia megaterium TaxID=1404 RepID=UPI00190CC826|nr:hypothetical protein [Priestia megaterium]MBK0010569.1 hypothetical protein [Bacillus sp. S35]MED3861122.1 hypothetical protein [Priestia megaterium]